MILSVSTWVMLMGTATPVSVVNVSIPCRSLKQGPIARISRHAKSHLHWERNNQPPTCAIQHALARRDAGCPQQRREQGSHGSQPESKPPTGRTAADRCL